MLEIIKGDLCSLGGTILILIMLGRVFADCAQKKWGGILALIAFLSYGVFACYTTPPKSAETLFQTTLCALVTFGLVLGLSWCGIPLIVGLVRPIVRTMQRSAEASRRAWEDLEKKWERQDQLAREAEERARTAPQREREKQQAEAAAREQKKAQRRRDDARAVVVFCYEQQGHLIGERLARARFDELVKEFLADSYPPEVVEHRAIELQNLILGHVHELEPPAKRRLESEAEQAVAEVKTYYEAHKELLQHVYPPALLASYLRLAAGFHLGPADRIAACHKLIEQLQGLVEKEREKRCKEEGTKQNADLERQKLLRLIRAYEEEIEELRKRGGKPDVVEVIDPGDLVDNLTARMARRVIDEGNTELLRNFHRFEPADYTMAFGWDPGKFDPAKPIHPEHRSNARRAWLHTTVQNSGEWVQLKQGQMDFEQNARLHRILTRAFTAGFTDVGGKHLGLPLVWILFDPDYPGSDDVFEKIAPFLDGATVSEIRRIRGYRNVEQRMKEIESFINRLNAILPPQAKAIFGSKYIVPLRKIILSQGTMLWQLRPSEYFSHDAKATFGKIAIHSVISTMMSMPPEMRVRHTLVIDEASEFANEFLLWALGALRKTGLSIWLCGQDLSSFRKRELDMVPKYLSQTNVVCFQQDWPDDVEILLRKIFAGDLDFTELMNEVERHAGYEWHRVRGTSESINITQNYTEGEKYEESEARGKTTGSQKGVGRTRSTSKSASESNGKVDTRSRPVTGTERPEQESHANSVSRVNGTAEVNGESTQESTSESETESSSKSRGTNTSRGAGIGRTQGTSESLTPLAKIVREKVGTGVLKTDLQVQYAKFAARIQSQKKKQALVKIVGKRHAVQIEALDVKPPFKSEAAQSKAIDWIKRELFDMHEEYSFVPNYDPSEDDKALREFLDDDVQPDEVIEKREKIEKTQDDNAYGY